MKRIGTDWQALLQEIEEAVRLLDNGDCTQPLKPYLRYGDPRNRIIAMPAYVGGAVHTAGLKWIASFPDNLRQGLPRAHSVTILNDADSGAPFALLHGALLSAVRTAAVSGLMLRRYSDILPAPADLRVGIIGWGPVGRLHLEMCAALFPDAVSQVIAHDIRPVDLELVPPSLQAATSIADSWPALYRQCNVVITCTASRDRYVSLPPQPGSLLLHVSLRDYEANALRSIPHIVVDDWREVCRENTDIEQLHLLHGLQEEDTISLRDVVCRDALSAVLTDPGKESVMFAPMGMAVFDIAVASWFVRESRRLDIGIALE
ncbi:2,3-diaminopropionate biosynthesis protein SbnB [Paenibacillus sp. J5C_2022]|uniref:2,3-diaminopropionate biosynthesis protein SbnB n=1 Tax=Paenibacillus sp. J5C2022 TaxID=2977129 RepID=UPI0021D2B83D|nr:2,3-diaminopropionate biosynthesis protein SbnB [Paenibacillus sp. J5C2022]MCU6712242.1 2,3-diaminopropionate biosynthesis protein SbnB [Paenibacillus sp. J5C2022]